MVTQSLDPKDKNRDFVQQWHQVIAPSGLGYRIKLLSQLMARKFQERLEPYGLTVFHWVVLCCLWEDDGLATSTLAERLQQVGGTLTGVLDRMEERGLVKRQRDRRDRRIWRIWLTESGRALQTDLPPISLEIREMSLKGMPEAERQHLSDLVDWAIANLSAESEE